MRLRSILLILSFLAIASIAVGGFYYFFSLREYERAVTYRRSVSQTETIRNHISSYLTGNMKSVRAMAGLGELRQALARPDQTSLAQANGILDHFKTSLGVDVCYLMDRTGLVIASSNRLDPDSFVGDNFAFRPYFREAAAGEAGKYLALGATSKKRGAYYSYPIYQSGGDRPAGVAVIKAAIRTLEESIIGSFEGVTMLVGPHDVIFSSNREGWLFKTLWQKSPEETGEIAASRQFGEGPWGWVGLKREEDHLVRDRSGRRYHYFDFDVANYAGWRVVHLLERRSVSASLFSPLVTTTGLVVLSLCLLAGLSVYLLNHKARVEIARREEAERGLRRSEERYRFLYHNTPALLHSIDGQGRLLSVSDYWTEALGYQAGEVVGRKLTDFLTEESRRYAEEVALPEFFRKGWCKDVAYQFVKKDGRAADVLLSAIAERGPDDEIERSLAVLTDVSTIKRTEEELRLAQEMLSQYSKDLERQVRQRTREITGFLQYTPAVVYMKDREGRYILVNSRYEELFGIRNEEVRGKTVYDVFPPEVADQFRKNDLKVLHRVKPYQVEESFPVGGEERTYLAVRFPILEGSGQVSRLCGISLDITDLKKARDQLRRLSGRIMDSQEKERTAIARELHDELGQILTALRMDAVWLREYLKEGDSPAGARARKMCRLIDKTISDVRHIATRLRPPILDDLGLVDALEWYTADFEKRTGLACVYTHFGVPALSGLRAVAAYRVAQEALTNVARHAGASNVEVRVQGGNGSLVVTVADDGKGFDPEGLSSQGGLGIAGMRERAGLVGGRLEIVSGPGEGTIIRLRLPLEEQRGGGA